MRARPLLAPLLGVWLLLLGVPAAQAADAAQSTPPADPSGEEGAADAEAGEEIAGVAGRVSCLDEVSPEGEPRKGVQRRPFLKARRFELAAVGGLWSSDVVSSSYTAGGAVSFYPSEDFGLEALVTYQPVSYKLDRSFSSFDRATRFEEGAAWQAMLALLYAPFHAKFKVNEETIVGGDVLFIGGAGRTFHDSVQGVTFEAGLGVRAYLGRMVSLRLDVRDFVLPQEVLGQGRVSHNVVVMGGIGVWVL